MKLFFEGKYGIFFNILFFKMKIPQLINYLTNNMSKVLSSFGNWLPSI
jgi:hypothetical protein